MRFGILQVMLSLLFFVAGGCGDESALSRNAVEGLTLFSDDPEVGLAGQFVLAGLVVSFETQRVPGFVVREDGTIQHYEIRGRFYDERGVTLASVSQGHGTPAEWSPNDGSVREEDILAVANAASALSALEVPGSLDQDLALLVTTGEDLLRESEIRALIASSLPDNRVTKSSCQYLEIVELFSKKAVWDSGANPFPYDHSGTVTWVYRSCGAGVVPIATIAKCNHGTCPANMSRYTYAMTGWRNSWMPPYHCDDWSGSDDWGVASYYDHLCNQDTFLEVGNVVRGLRNGNDTYRHICYNKYYGDYTGLDHKNRPWVGHVSSFINRYGWEYVPSSDPPAPPAPPPPNPVPDEPNCGPHRC